jgi:c(7)-type cytochrome triheme protein
MAWYPTRLRILGVTLVTVLVMSAALACVSDTASERISGTQFDFVGKYEKLPPPSHYGNILISRLTHSSTHPTVAFSHWVHRRYYTCRVCHSELNFAMKTNASDITEAKNRQGDYCGACHNGKIAFGINDSTCRNCHTGKISTSDDRFSLLKDFPKGKVRR